MQTIIQYIKPLLHQIKLQFMCMDISCILVRIGWILFFFLGCYQLSYGQNGRTTYNQTIDYINCEFAKQSIKEFDAELLAKYQLEFPNCLGTTDEFAPELYKFLSDNKMFGTVKLCSAINAFKKEYDKEFMPGDEIDEEDIYNALKDKIFAIPKIQAFQTNHRSTFPGLKSKIRKELQMTLVPELMMENDNVEVSNPSNTNSYVQSGQDEYDYEEVLEDNNPTRFSSRDYGGNGIISRRDILWLFSLLMFGLLAFYFIRSVMPRYTVSQDYQSLQIDDDETKNLLDKLTNRVGDLKEEHNDLVEEINQISFRINNLDRTVDIQKTAVQAIEESIEESIDEVAMIPDDLDFEDEIGFEMTEFFLPIPNPEGSFNAIDALEDFKRTDTVYEFRLLDNNDSQAEFQVVDDVATMLRALDDPDTYLKPACRSNAIIPISATKIITDEKGIALLRNNEWQIIKKALIHYV